VGDHFVQPPAWEDYAMSYSSADQEFKLFTACPASAEADAETYLHRVREVARWSEDAGCEGILVYADNRQVDPWLVSQVIVTATERLCPLVAVQPAYMHPYSVAKMITSLAFLFGRRVYLNMVAGGFRNDLIALNDETPHNERYARLVEYTTVIQKLLQAPGPVSFEGNYYRIANLPLTPRLADELQPGLLVSGSSEAGSNAAQSLGATAIEYPKPAAECTPRPAYAGGYGIRIGIIARDDEAEAWEVARNRFPEDRKGQLTRKLANKVSDSSWHQELAERAEAQTQAETPYWLVPFQNYKTMCPYLVGSYERVGQELVEYVGCGYTTFVLDEPPSAEEMQHVGIAFQRAFKMAKAA